MTSQKKITNARTQLNRRVYNRASSIQLLNGSKPASGLVDLDVRQSGEGLRQKPLPIDVTSVAVNTAMRWLLPVTCVGCSIGRSSLLSWRELNRPWKQSGWPDKLDLQGVEHDWKISDTPRFRLLYLRSTFFYIKLLYGFKRLFWDTILFKKNKKF